MTLDTLSREIPTPSEDARAFWAPRLRAGGATTLPRWSSAPHDGVVSAHADLPAGLYAEVRATAARLGVEPAALVLAAHARVVAALTGETEVGLAVETGTDSFPLHLGLGVDSWDDLVRQVGRELGEVRAHPVEDLAGLASELQIPLPHSEVRLHVTEYPHDLDHGQVVSVHIDERAVHVLALASAVDVDAAVRLAGYHVRAVRGLVEEPSVAPLRSALLSDPELDLQLRGMGGPVRPLPDRRFHQLVEERVRQHPETVAAVHRGESVTYAELNARANQLARGLQARGLTREGVVAVVTERNLDWMAAVLAVFKSGGAYLPIEPHFPAERIATTLRRSGAVVALTENGSTTTLDVALESVAVQRLLVDEVLAEGHATEDLDTEVGEDQLAYLYFTSGSTGEPKGAMCEQAGMINHLLAKIEDLGIGEGDVVAQTAPQCFDISLWQLVSALLVGGRTQIIEQEAILGVEQMVGQLVSGRVAVLQVVPSYLEVVMTYLEANPTDLPDLRVVSVTGEAVKRELVERWFGIVPDVAVVNAYGLTETSDDTNHEVMHGPPTGTRVPLGPPIRNAVVYVVDEDLQPVPLGAPGEIVFSGVCVGRGYVNDPERTAAAFVQDPHVRGERLYRSGDFGRWRPDGKLEFLGRRDTQLKISGFRIEIGEIENTLLRADGVKDAAVVVVDGPDGSRHLVGFYDADAEIPPARLKDHLAASLPHYMVPGTTHWMRGLPLSANGKIDRKVLTARAAELDQPIEGAGGGRPVSTPSEVRVAAAWARALGMPATDFAADDHFFERGGTSLSAVKVVIGLQKAVTLKDVTVHPVLSDLAAVLDGVGTTRTGLLHPLSSSVTTTPTPSPGTVLVCLPHAGGNTVNYQPLARELAAVGSDVAVWAVELPGHDLSGEREPFEPLDQVADRVCAEVASLGAARVVLWGHSAGAALALAVAERLEARGSTPTRVFLGAQLAGTPDGRRQALVDLAGLSDLDLAAGLATPGGSDEDGGAERAAHLAAAYRHDVATASAWLADRLDQPSAPRIAAPVTVVVAADDPATAGAQERHVDWLALATRVDFVVLPEGGHHFLRTAPAAVATVVVDGCVTPPPATPAATSDATSAASPDHQTEGSS